jgi:hypothetical protein
MIIVNGIVRIIEILLIFIHNSNGSIVAKKWGKRKVLGEFEITHLVVSIGKRWINVGESIRNYTLHP